MRDAHLVLLREASAQQAQQLQTQRLVGGTVEHRVDVDADGGGADGGAEGHGHLGGGQRPHHPEVLHELQEASHGDLAALHLPGITEGFNNTFLCTLTSNSPTLQGCRRG